MITYIDKEETNAKHLLHSLGAFWNQIFQERETLRGYTYGEAEEAIQNYYNLIEAVNSFSIDDIDVLHTERWFPLIIKKSSFNAAPLTFGDTVVFGPQPPADAFFAGKVFQFGRPKTPNENAFVFTPSVPLKQFSVIANRVLTPTVTYINGVDVIIDGASLYFNTNPFDEADIPKINLIDELGQPVVYTDLNGAAQQDQEIILWVYHGKFDLNSVYNNLGFVVGFNLENQEQYKKIVGALFDLFVDGPTVHNLKQVISFFLNSPLSIHATETIEEIYTNSVNNVVVTDKEVYLFDLYTPINPDLVPGGTIVMGTVLTNLIKYVDNMVQTNWWETEFSNMETVAFPSAIFAAGLSNQLLFSNTLDLITLSSDNVLHFPVAGQPEGVEAFNARLNESEYKEAIKTALGLKIDPLVPTNSVLSVPIVPLEFVFDNFFKNNIFLLSYNFSDINDTSAFFSLFSTFVHYFPKHVFMLQLIATSVGTETFNDFDEILELGDFPGELFDIDGSVPATGSRPEIIPSDPNYYKDFDNRLFSVAIAPIFGGNQGNTYFTSSSEMYDTVQAYDGYQNITITGTDGVASGGTNEFASASAVFSAITELPDFRYFIHIATLGVFEVTSVLDANTITVNDLLDAGSPLVYRLYNAPNMEDAKVTTEVLAGATTRTVQHLNIMTFTT